MPDERAGFVFVADVQFGADHLKRRKQRLHRVNAGAPSLRFSAGPADIEAANPVDLRLFGSMNVNGNFAIGSSVAQSQQTCGDNHDSTFKMAMEGSVGLRGMRRSVQWLALDTPLDTNSALVNRIGAYRPTFDSSSMQLTALPL